MNWKSGLALAVLAGQLCAQTAPATVYVESFRKGPTHIAETSFELTLDNKNPSYEARIKDAAGEQRYQLSLVPMRVGPGDDRILSWQVSLVDLKRRSYGNLLLASRDPYLNQGVKSAISRLDPNVYAVVPILAKRVVKVEDFYCVIQVSKYHLLTPERWYLDNMSLKVSLTNSNPLND
jgi:hypothetical protein